MTETTPPDTDSDLSLVQLTQPTSDEETRPIWVNPRTVALVYGAGPPGGGPTVIKLGPDAAAVTVTEPVDDVTAALSRQLRALDEPADGAVRDGRKQTRSITLAPAVVRATRRMANRMGTDVDVAETVRRAPAVPHVWRRVRQEAPPLGPPPVFGLLTEQTGGVGARTPTPPTRRARRANARPSR